MAALLALLLVESLLGYGVRGSPGPLSVQATILPGGTGGSLARVSIESSSLTLAAHLAFLPSGPPRPSDKIYLLEDPAYPGLYIAPSDLTFVPVRLSGFLGLMGSSVKVETITGAQAPGILASDPRAVLMVVGTPVPDSILSNSSAVLASWIQAGGTLVWAGGPLGFSSGHPESGGRFVYDGLLWKGQTDLVGFPLTDPQPMLPKGSPTSLPTPPLEGTDPTPFGQALGTLYVGTADGANVSEVENHGGVVLGTEAPPAAGFHGSARASLIYVPVGLGGVFFFGGADLSSYQGFVPFADGWITDGSLDIAEDTAVLLGTGYDPVPGPVVSQDLSVPPYGTVSTTLSLATNLSSATLIVRSTVDGSVLDLWGTTTVLAQHPIVLAPGLGTGARRR